MALADKVGCSEIVGRVVEDLKDESEPYRRMVMETIEKVRGSCRAVACGHGRMVAGDVVRDELRWRRNACVMMCDVCVVRCVRCKARMSWLARGSPCSGTVTVPVAVHVSSGVHRIPEIVQVHLSWHNYHDRRQS